MNLDGDFPAGPAVQGADFVGRGLEIGELLALLSSRNNISITGLPRIGKTSLVRNLISQVRESNCYPELRFVELALTKAQRADDFFAELSKRLYKLAYDGDSPPPQDVDRYYAIQFHMDQIEATMQEFERRGLRVCVVVDEFDFAPAVLGSTISTVREQFLSSPYFSNVSMMTVSQASLQQLLELRVGSDFPGLFGNGSLTLRGFSDHDLDTFRQLAATRCPGLGSSPWEFIRTQAGNHPFLLACWVNSAIKFGLDHPEASEEAMLSALRAVAPDHRSAVGYQLKAIRRLQLGRQLSDIIAAGEGSLVRHPVEFRDARLYGLIDESDRLTIPSLADSGAWVDASAADLDDFRTVELLSKSALDLATRKHNEVGLSLPANTMRQLRVHMNELQAIQSVCACLFELDQLDSGLLDATAELLAAMQSRLSDSTQFIERL